MTRTMALDLAEYGIRVNAVAPGATWTERMPTLGPTRMHRYAERVPLKRIVMPLEIGAAVAFLALPDADYITGQVIYVEGGIRIQLGTRARPSWR
jgi:NAD(P)-dependent dehydrogenase (short-subunit alcohol dehydrogenase family)